MVDCSSRDIREALDHSSAKSPHTFLMSTYSGKWVLADIGIVQASAFLHPTTLFCTIFYCSTQDNCIKSKVYTGSEGPNLNLLLVPSVPAWIEEQVQFPTYIFQILIIWRIIVECKWPESVCRCSSVILSLGTSFQEQPPLVTTEKTTRYWDIDNKIVKPSQATTIASRLCTYVIFSLPFFFLLRSGSTCVGWCVFSCEHTVPPCVLFAVSKKHLVRMPG